MNVEHNISRLNYLINLFDLSIQDLLNMISGGLKNPITQDDIFSNEIKLSHLKRIDKVFNKGIHYYLDPKSLEEKKEASIFFRKNNFGTELNIEAKRIVNKFEDLKISLSAIAKLSELQFERILPVYTINEDPKKIAYKIRSILYPKDFSLNKRDFLKSLIYKFSEHNILVFEFVETWNKKERANIDGFFLNPNVIVLKRQQKSFRREIFTLAHELGHYLLNEEEVESLDYSASHLKSLNRIERWCNDFAFHFLAGEYSNIIQSIDKANKNNDYYWQELDEISQKTHLSVISLYTRLLIDGKITPKNYNIIKSDIDEVFREKLEEENRLKTLEKQMGIKRQGRAPKPINSPLFINTLQSALYGGLINEYDFCKNLNINAENIDKYI